MIRIHRPSLTPQMEDELAVEQGKVQPESGNAETVWKRYRSSPNGRALFKHLAKASYHKCSYCEDTRARTIDHFHPKAEYPFWTFDWDNLNLACDNCQGYKGDRLSIGEGGALLLNPMGVEETGDYFFVSTLSGKITPANTLTPYEQHRAQHTIDTLHLDDPTLRKLRQTAAKTLLLAMKAYCRHPSKANAAIVVDALDVKKPVRAVVRQIIRTKDPRLLKWVGPCLQSPFISSYVAKQNWT